MGLTPRDLGCPGIVPWLGWAWEPEIQTLSDSNNQENPSIIIKIHIKQFILSLMWSLVFVYHYCWGKHVHCTLGCNWYRISVIVESSWLMSFGNILPGSAFPHTQTLFMQLCPLPVVLIGNSESGFACVQIIQTSIPRISMEPLTILCINLSSSDFRSKDKFVLTFRYRMIWKLWSKSYQQ